MSIEGFTKGPMAPAAVYEIVRKQEGKGEYGHFTGWKGGKPTQISITRKDPAANGNGNGGIPPVIPTPPNMWEWIFPPAGLWNLATGPKDPGTGLPGTYTMDLLSGSGGGFLDPGAAATPSDDIGGLIGNVSEAAKWILLLVVAGGAVGLIGKFKRLF